MPSSGRRMTLPGGSSGSSRARSGALYRFSGSRTVMDMAHAPFPSVNGPQAVHSGLQAVPQGLGQGQTLQLRAGGEHPGSGPP